MNRKNPFKNNSCSSYYAKIILTGIENTSVCLGGPVHNHYCIYMHTIYHHLPFIIGQSLGLFKATLLIKLDHQFNTHENANDH